jgi:flagellar biosynthesis protein FlhF
MKLKSYFSGTVEAAIELAHHELGEDALLVNVRPAAIETRHLGAYEVVFGVTAAPGEGDGPPAATALAGTTSGQLPAQDRPTPGRPASDRSASDRLGEDLADLRRQIARMSDAVRGSRGFAASFAAGSAAARSELCARLVEAELDPELAQLVAQGTPLEDFCSVDATLGRPGAARAVVALVGPPGVGKTTTLAKLAVRYGMAGRRRAHFISTDVFRVAAAEQLRTLAAILGLGCDVVETPAALEQALEEHRLKDLVLIDTPGLGSADLEDGRELARTLAAHAEADIHLVLPASMKALDLARTADQFAMFRPAKLLFTRLDETVRFGALVSEAARSRLPISFLATGQDIPEALEPATRERLAALIEEGPALSANRAVSADYPSARAAGASA